MAQENPPNISTECNRSSGGDDVEADTLFAFAFAFAFLLFHFTPGTTRPSSPGEVWTLSAI
jgi:hypothetical protein